MSPLNAEHASHLLYISYDNTYHTSWYIEATTEDIVPVSSNPAYVNVTCIGSRNIKTQDNSAYVVVHPTVSENIGVESEQNTKHDYEDVDNTILSTVV